MKYPSEGSRLYRRERLYACQIMHYIISYRVEKAANFPDEYAVDLVHPFRLVFKPILRDGVDIYDLESIDIIRIEEVTDYHGKQKR
ncbi:hypothetical protein [Desulfallas thermosapovorans]|uniref:Uncharacterized protein n=1 Tax=Desulfallas thermosapovorans DSM 6562 TaxID=1121431 RepID=A0A5S4ZVN8_9FIRM|nr:hypothetical protein [Desulfallas thermosapovorans]TYO96918.1 hypothetical protein LX24_00728 [Desulfallas thermosapovorans DSM 6562]